MMTAKVDKSFFDVYPQEYDALTNAAGREKAHRDEVASIISRFNPSSVLDAGCATGLTSRLFAEFGVPAVGLDKSKAMIDIARYKSHYDSRLLSFMVGRFERLPKVLNGRFDLVACLANSISGVDTIANLRKAMSGFFRVLKPGGSIVLQMLNYGSIKEDQIMPVRATQNGTVIYQRFTERKGKRLYLYVTRMDTATKPPALAVFRHEMENFSVVEIETGLKQAGFKSLRRYADLYFSKQFTRSSRDLVVTARK